MYKVLSNAPVKDTKTIRLDIGSLHNLLTGTPKNNDFLTMCG